MSMGDRQDILTKVQKISFIFICASTPISICVLFLWVLGVPGVQNNYERGWSLGLSALFHYFLGSCMVLIVYGIVAKLAQRFRNLNRINLAVIISFWILFFNTGFKLIQAFEIMLSLS